jgi:hypothetical protein
VILFMPLFLLGMVLCLPLVLFVVCFIGLTLIAIYFVGRKRSYGGS